MWRPSAAGSFQRERFELIDAYMALQRLRFAAIWRGL
jgi:hypothetical protein